MLHNLYYTNNSCRPFENLFLPFDIIISEKDKREIFFLKMIVAGKTRARAMRARTRNRHHRTTC